MGASQVLPSRKAATAAPAPRPRQSRRPCPAGRAASRFDGATAPARAVERPPPAQRRISLLAGILAGRTASSSGMSSRAWLATSSPPVNGPRGADTDPAPSPASTSTSAVPGRRAKQRREPDGASDGDAGEEATATRGEPRRAGWVARPGSAPGTRRVCRVRGAASRSSGRGQREEVPQVARNTRFVGSSRPLGAKHGNPRRAQAPHGGSTEPEVAAQQQPSSSVQAASTAARRGTHGSGGRTRYSSGARCWSHQVPGAAARAAVGERQVGEQPPARRGRARSRRRAMPWSKSDDGAVAVVGVQERPTSTSARTGSGSAQRGRTHLRVQPSGDRRARRAAAGRSRRPARSSPAHQQVGAQARRTRRRSYPSRSPAARPSPRRTRRVPAASACRRPRREAEATV